MTQTPKGVTARAFIKALQEDGFQEMRVRGSHHIYRHPDGRRVVLAYHALNDTFAIGTIKGMINDIGWDEQDLRRLKLLKQ